MNHTRSYDEFIDEYRLRYEIIKKQKKIALQNLVPDMTYNGGEKNGQVVSFEQYKLGFLRLCPFSKKHFF